jgi:2-dehydropantoate 2-reductase
MIAILGAGGVGGFLAAALARAGEPVTLIAREATAELLAAGGLRVRSRLLGDFTARPLVTSSLSVACDALLVATKANGLDAALERVTEPPRLIVPLLNGVEHLQTLRDRFGSAGVAAAVVRVDSDRRAAGEILQVSPGCRVDLVPPGGDATAVATVANALKRAGIDVRVGGDEPTVMWSKLARLCPLALTTSAALQPIGFVRSDPRWRSALEGAVKETVAVGQAEGAQLRAADTIAELESAHEDLGSSMQRDVLAGREPELDAIAGAVLRAGDRHGLRCLTVQWLADRVATRAGVPWINA